MRYLILAPEKTLRLYEVPEASLVRFSQDNRKYAYTNMPDDSYRRRDKELAGADEDEESKNES